MVLVENLKKKTNPLGEGGREDGVKALALDPRPRFTS